MFLLSANLAAEASERDPTANTSASGRERRPCTNCLAMAPVPSIPHRNFLTTCAPFPSPPHKARSTSRDATHSVARNQTAEVAPGLPWYVESGYHYLEGVNRGVQEPRKNRREGQRALPRVHDVRGKDGPGGLGGYHRPRHRRGYQFPRHGERLQHGRQRGGCREGATAERQARRLRARDQGARGDGQGRSKRRGKPQAPHHRAV